MINDYLVIQERLNHYSYYIKSLIVSLCEEFQTDKVHIRRLSTVLERILANENQVFKSFFNDEKQSLAMQLIQYITQQGEILHIKEGYYTLPPERAIQMPDGRCFVISSLKPSTGKSLGIAAHFQDAPSITLSHQQYLHRPTFEELITIYSNKLSNNHDVEPNEMIYFKSKGVFKTKRIVNMRENEFYILLFERPISNTRTKLERYLARWKNGEWQVAKINNMSHYFRLRLALSYQMKYLYTYKLIIHKNSFIELQVPFLLSEEEHRLLRLIATPEQFKWPKHYLSTLDQLENIEKILGHCHFKREEE